MLRVGCNATAVQPVPFEHMCDFLLAAFVIYLRHLKNVSFQNGVLFYTRYCLLVIIMASMIIISWSGFCCCVLVLGTLVFHLLHPLSCAPLTVGRPGGSSC